MGLSMFQCAESNSRIIHKTTLPLGKHLVISQRMVQAVGDCPRVIASCNENREYVWAEAVVYDSYADLRVFEHVGGTDNEIASSGRIIGVRPTVPFSLAICCDNQKVVAAIADGEGENVVRCRGETVAVGNMAGLGTGAVVNKIVFVSFEVRTHYPTTCNEHPLTSKDGCPSCGYVCPCCGVDFRRN